MARKTKAEALATRNHILDAAEAMFCARGVARTSLHEIADHIDLTRGAVYWHFRDKYDLLRALWERAMLPIEQVFDEIDAEFADDPLARIRQKGARIFHRIVHDARTRNLLTVLLLRCEMVDEVAAAREHILGCREECLAKMKDEFAQAIARRQLRANLDPEHAAIGLHALVDGLAYHWLLDPRRFDLERTGEHLLGSYLAGLAHAVPAVRAVAMRRAANGRSRNTKNPRAAKSATGTRARARAGSA